MKRVVGVGAALVDLIASVSEEWIVRQKKTKGGMNLMNWGEIGRILGNIERVETVPGGSASNTMIGLSRLGGLARFICKVGNDDLGDVYSLSLYRNMVEGYIRKSSTPTGRVISAVTPDAQRTMFTYTGASAELLPSEIGDAPFSNADILYLEGYLAYNPSLLLHCASVAKNIGLEVALDCGSFGVIQDCRFIIDKMVEDHSIDILIANEDEARILTSVEEELACMEMAKIAKIAIVKVGKKGSIICEKDKVLKVGTPNVKALDTTGAGDLWASGFLYGYSNGWPLEKCAELASATASEVIQVLGPIIPDAGYERLIQIRDKLAKS
ncbi:MAG: adenosine kinase [Fibromonadales bacterium]|nr:adenosine kinase [Fibromonadales bacterium]MCL2208028.1 adenosine kinase [Fibromonadales bacterium]